MKPINALALAALILGSPIQAGEKPKQETAGPRPLIGNYQVYAGSLSDMLPPTPTDRNLLIQFEGQTARDLFGYIGPDRKREKSCTADSDYRERRRGDLTCVHWTSSGYRCFLGLDLKSGKSINGSTC